MTKEQKQEIWDYIIQLALKCASESDKDPFNIVEQKKKQLKMID